MNNILFIFLLNLPTCGQTMTEKREVPSCKEKECLTVQKVLLVLAYWIQKLFPQPNSRVVG